MATTSKEYVIPDISPELARGPVWLRERRQQAREEFNKTPLPRRGLHLWRYTDPAKFLVEHDNTTDTAFDEDYDVVRKIEREYLKAGHLSGMVVDFGGREITRNDTEDLENTGVIVTSLSDAVEQHRDLVEPYLYELVNSQTGKFEAMNGALWNDGIFIFVPDGTTVEKPLHLLREGGRAGSTNYLRLLVVVGENAELTLVDEYGGGSLSYKNGYSYTNSAVEIFGLQNSRIRYVPLQRQAGGMTSFLTHRARIERDATMLTIPLAFGAALSKQNFGVVLNGERAESNMYGLLFGTGRQHFDNHTLHHHAAGQTMSNIDFKVVLRDRALSAYTGLIRIEEGAQVCEAYQENRNLLLNPGTKAETIPELEILNEEVSCSHGATVGPIDPLEVFYLTSRGIEVSEAIRMIVSGFVASTLQLVPADLRERIEGFVYKRLEDI
jgi:Fe-S cluster assembly protein SufD